MCDYSRSTFVGVLSSLFLRRNLSFCSSLNSCTQDTARINAVFKMSAVIEGEKFTTRAVTHLSVVLMSADCSISP